MADLLQQIANFIGQKTPGALEHFQIIVPDEAAWEYVLQELRKANRPNLRYVAKVLNSWLTRNGANTEGRSPDSPHRATLAGQGDRLQVLCPHCGNKQSIYKTEQRLSLIFCDSCGEPITPSGEPYTFDAQYQEHHSGPEPLGNIMRRMK